MAINPSTNQPINQPSNQATKKPSNQATKKPSNQATNQHHALEISPFLRRAPRSLGSPPRPRSLRWCLATCHENRPRIQQDRLVPGLGWDGFGLSWVAGSWVSVDLGWVWVGPGWGCVELSLTIANISCLAMKTEAAT